jgi:hypothetical protein
MSRVFSSSLTGNFPPRWSYVGLFPEDIRSCVLGHSLVGRTGGEQTSKSAGDIKQERKIPKEIIEICRYNRHRYLDTS